MSSNNITCPKCKTGDPLLQTMRKNRSCLTYFIYLVLILIPVFGWIVLFIFLVTGNKPFTAATCQKCGHSWNIDKPWEKIR